MDPTRPQLPDRSTLTSNAIVKREKPQPKAQPLARVTSGKVTTKKKPITQKMADLFISEDAGDIKSYILYDILIPAAKDTIADMVGKTVDMLFYGKTSRGRRSSSGGGYVSYSSYSSNKPRDYARPRITHEFDDIIFETREEAETVIDAMVERLEDYQSVSIDDFYDLAGVTSKNYTDRYYGWTDLRSASVIRERGGGYSIKLPRPVELR